MKIATFPPTPARLALRLARVVAVFAAAALATPAHADIIYSETFDSATNTSLSQFGWTGYRNDGTNFSNSTSDPMLVLSNGWVFIGSSNQGGHQYAALADAAPTINPALYEDDLTITFDQSVDGSGATNRVNWRLLAQVDGTWYASDLLGSTRHIAPRSAKPSDEVWHAWETDLTNGFNIGGISGTATLLPSGLITGTGVLAMDSTTSNDRLRIHSYEITGTFIPEPSSLVLGLIGLALLVAKRRRRGK